jgi:hypothetical protein
MFANMKFGMASFFKKAQKGVEDYKKTDQAKNISASMSNMWQRTKENTANAAKATSDFTQRKKEEARSVAAAAGEKMAPVLAAAKSKTDAAGTVIDQKIQANPKLAAAKTSALTNIKAAGSFFSKTWFTMTKSNVEEE